MMRTLLALVVLLLASTAATATSYPRKYRFFAGRYGKYGQVTVGQARSAFQERLAGVIAGGPAPSPLATGIGELQVPIRGRKLQQDGRLDDQPFILS